MALNAPPSPTNSIIPLFPTPLGVFILPNAAELKPGLVAAILQREQEQEVHVATNNIGGWHSTWDLLQWPVSEITTLKEWLNLTVQYMIGAVTRQNQFSVSLDWYAWANINRAHGYREEHHHPYAHWSGVYYVQVGAYAEENHPHAGQIVFRDPRGAINMFPHPGKTDFGSSHPVTPTEGLLLVFPSWLEHFVHSFNDGPDRITISFNARVTAFEANPGVSG
jgi:uncharacterized protein (TIGR02466 family)